MTPKNILIIIRQAPYSSVLPASALDVLLTAAAFEQMQRSCALAAEVCRERPALARVQQGAEGLCLEERDGDEVAAGGLGLEGGGVHQRDELLEVERGVLIVRVDAGSEHGSV